MVAAAVIYTDARCPRASDRMPGPSAYVYAHHEIDAIVSEKISRDHWAARARLGIPTESSMVLENIRNVHISLYVGCSFVDLILL